MKKPVADQKFELGVCYYPEHWPEEMWDDDYRRMVETGFTIVRMGEFAWSIFEPEEGRFQFGLFDKAIDLAHSHGLKVILGTPTATPPAWLTEKYPEVLNVTQEGVTLQHGMRRHYNYSSPKYRELCARIVTQMAERYSSHPGVAGWQIDNELNCEINVFYSESDHTAFREWLQRKYGTLDKLNEAWGTVFWNQSYTSWSQVFLPRPTPVPGQPNPHQALDEKRFISDNSISFAKVQADILREKAPGQWVTTNGLFGHLDSHELSDEMLDFFSYDSYPQFSSISNDLNERNPLADRSWSLSLSVVRSISPNYCIMEQQSGPGGWVNRMDMPSPKPGQMRLWTYQSIAHGADMVLYFRWRTATMGNEIYWHGINDYHNLPNRRVREAAEIGKELGAAGKTIIGTTAKASIAIVRDYDNEWDGEYDIWHGPFMWQSNKEWFKALQHKHIPTDIVYIRSKTTAEELSRYEVLVYPHPAIMTDETAALLDEYVQQGGKLIFGCRTGYKDSRGHCYMRAFPGAAKELCGITVEEFTMVKGRRLPTTIKWAHGSDELTGADSFNDILHVEADTVEVMGTYASDYYAGKPAVTRNKRGLGEVWYYGAVFNEEAAVRIIDSLELASPAAGWLELPAEVELQIRSSESASLTFLLNYNELPVEILLKEARTDLLTGRILEGKFIMDGFGVLVLQ
ncbi:MULTISPECIES: beta-galactosidase [unclassified Paenibacillus]|uniref:beta-galactosidase n=1 Tax=unclassified Paenibacillus TaxID=185978 RepID=UPI0024059850|nr:MULTISPECIES: beta-galactosidase [unclassified Paenibacillus]MDF9839164.1 beta-galactosidase [Paenibacillus sp. PastF-2]MDF9845746.1 beta-galactosidase [Paenibacillus sp. PastM-2]MDF9852318.1 beta-galactosidase [Paenibacillus sp. PastF-1]MDH6477952.1 beta-galactosidase [Paenibacillus sp. PastH-2]